MTHIYDIGGYRIYHGDCLTLDIEPVDVMITDPPFAPKTHSNARTNKGRQKGGSDLVDFAPLDYDGLVERLECLARFVKTWAVFTCEWTYAAKLDKNPPSGWEFVRCGIWTKPDGAPQITGDRPGQVAKQLGRKAIGCDISEKACRLAESRLAQEILVI